MLPYRNLTFMCLAALGLLFLDAPALAQNQTAEENRIQVISGREGPYAVYSMIVRINADPDTVWNIAGDWSLAEMKSAFLERVDVEGTGNGAIRTIYAKEEIGGGYVVERQHSRDDELRTYSYTLLESGPLPWVDYRGTTAVMGFANGQSLIFYDVKFIPYGQSHAEAIALSIANNKPWMRALIERFDPTDKE